MLRRIITCLCAAAVLLAGCVQINLKESNKSQNLTASRVGEIRTEAGNPEKTAETSSPATSDKTDSTDNTEKPTVTVGTESKPVTENSREPVIETPVAEIVRESASPPPLIPIQMDFNSYTTNETPFDPWFSLESTPCYFNEHEVITNKSGLAAGSANLTINNNFAWQATDDGVSVLMILVDTDKNWQSENSNLVLPKYGTPIIGKNGPDINIVWKNPTNENEGIWLTFQNGSGNMWVMQNTPKGVTGKGDGYYVELAAQPFDDGSGENRFYLPLYAILNEIGGGMIINPLGDGTDFIYSGDAISGFTGMWETSDRGETRMDVVVEGTTYSVASYWSGLELCPDGTFIETDRFWQDSNEWVLTEKKGDYVFFGRILIMRYKTESMYRGADYTALIPCELGKPAENWGKVTGACVYARYIEDWDEDYLQIYNWNPLYQGLVESGEAAPRAGKINNYNPS